MSGAVTRQPVHAHLLELRRRLLWSAAAFFVASAGAYLYHRQIISLLLLPLHQSVYYTTPSGGFEFLIRISSMVGLIVVVPVITFHLLKFIEPALNFRFSRKQLLLTLASSLGLLAIGVAFGYKIILPLTLHFFAGFGSSQIKALISANDYLSLVIGLLATFAVLFQLPLIILLINHIRPLTPGKLMHYQRHVLIGSMAIALALPFTYDPVTQFVMAVPIIGLYELSIILVWLANRRRRPLSLEQDGDQISMGLPPIDIPKSKLPDRPLPSITGPHILDLRSRH